MYPFRETHLLKFQKQIFSITSLDLTTEAIALVNYLIRTILGDRYDSKRFQALEFFERGQKTFFGKVMLLCTVVKATSQRQHYLKVAFVVCLLIC